MIARVTNQQRSWFTVSYPYIFLVTQFLKWFFLWKVYHQSNEKHFNFFTNGNTINVIYEYNSISQTINAVSKSQNSKQIQLIKSCLEFFKKLTGMSVWSMKGCSFPLPLNLSIYNIHTSQCLKQKMEPLSKSLDVPRPHNINVSKAVLLYSIKSGVDQLIRYCEYSSLKN